MFLGLDVSADIDFICNRLQAIVEENDIRQSLEKLNELEIIKHISIIFQVYSLKQKKKYYPFAEKYIQHIIQYIHPWSTSYVSSILCYFIENSIRSQKEYAYSALKTLIETNPKQIRMDIPLLISIISSDVNDVDINVKTNASSALELLLKCSGNADLDVFIPVVLKGIKQPDTIYNAVESLASCVFVQNVEAPALAITTPILYRGLNDKKTVTKRLSSTIIDNMCKLIEHPKEIMPFYAKLKVQLEHATDVISDPEARSVCERALNTLKSSCSSNETLSFIQTHEDFQKIIQTECNAQSVPVEISDIQYLSILVTNMCNNHFFEEESWYKVFSDYQSVLTKEVLSTVLVNILNYAKSLYEIKEEVFEDTEEGKNLYQGNFSLAYGALTLLNNTHLHLKQNRFYGLLGPNNCGKTTLMRAISHEQIEGFPKQDELKTVFVEHEIQEMEVGEDEKGFPILNIDLCGVDWVVHCCNVIYKMSPLVVREDVEKVMEEIGFGNAKKNIGKDRAADMEMGVTTYSGGWKMKMQLCAATLMNADILMLDEPTGHLDVTNIAWLKTWLKDFMEKGGSIITTSHDSSFLNESCTHIIDFQNRKLKMFKGTKGSVLQEFVENFPEKKGYFELKNDVVKFVFPEPGVLEGIKSMSKTILKMKDVTFTYPTRDTPTIYNINIECSRNSRVGVIGANGAGKSTAIKILIGELKTTQGEVIKHPGLRLAYIAQHAFHHLEKHIHKTPTQYIMWRFAGNEDQEGLDIINKEDNNEKQVVKYYIDSVDNELKMCYLPEEEKRAVEPESILSRREDKKMKIKMYEVKWKGKPIENTMWVNRDILIKMGAIKLVQRHDEKEAVAAGLASKTLTTKDIEKYFADFGITPEQANHTLIKSLSGGQKVKVVLAASLWQSPHIIILDEPTNYLDRDGLGALTNAIHEYKGGVVIISHNREFTNAVTSEKWIMEKGRLRREGESIDRGEEEKKDSIESKNEVIYDSMGNEIKVERKVQMTDKERKKEIKSIQKRIKDGKKKNILTQSELEELEEKLFELEGEEKM